MEYQKQVEAAHQKQQEAKATFHVVEGQCAALEAKTHQVYQDIPVVLATAAPVVKL